MKLQYLNKFLSDNHIDTGINCILYNFESGNISGSFIKNLINSNIEQYGLKDGEINLTTLKSISFNSDAIYRFKSPRNNTLAEIFNPALFEDYESLIIFYEGSLDGPHDSVLIGDSSWFDSTFSNIINNYIIPTNSILAFSTNQNINIPVRGRASIVKYNSDKYLIRDYYPGYLTNYYDKNYRYTGMAYFEGDNILKISKNIDSPNFNLILNFKSYGCGPDYVDINPNNEKEPSGVFLNYKFYERTNYESGAQFSRNNKYLTFNRSGLFGDYGDWSYSYSGSNYQLIQEGIESKLPRNFFDIYAKTSNNFLLGKIESLINLKSKINSNFPFDLKVGIINNYKLIFEFSGKTGESEIIFNKICTGELGNQNIISLNGNKNNISVCYHDFLMNRNFCETININSNFLNQEKEIYIGNNYTGYNGEYYTGYRGLISDVLLFTGFLNQETELSLSKLFIKTGEHTGIVETAQTNYNLLSSGYITTGYIGTGITGYELIKINELKDNNYTFYQKSGITGFLTGDVIKYQLVQEISTSYIESGSIIEDYNSGDANYFAKNYLIFYKPIDNKDFLEIQTYELFNNIKNLDYSLGGDIYNSKFDLKNKNLIFFNGVDIMSGYYEIKDIKKLFINAYKKDFKDNVLYKELPNNVKEYKFSYTGQDKVFFDGMNYTGLNLFLNGQKLINNYNYSYVSNIGDLYIFDEKITYYGVGISYYDLTNTNYNETSRYIYINNNTLNATGEMYITEDPAVKYTTGQNEFLNLEPNYGSDLIWLNGILQNEFEDYIFLSCNNNSIKSQEQKISKIEPIYYFEPYRFNNV
jgi:hypothetical protein